MNIFTYIQHLYTAFVLCKCVLTYIFSNYYKINKEGRTRVGLESNRGAQSRTHGGSERAVWWLAAVHFSRNILPPLGRGHVPDSINLYTCAKYASHYLLLCSIYTSGGVSHALEAQPLCSVYVGSWCRPIWEQEDTFAHVLTLPFMCGY